MPHDTHLVSSFWMQHVPHCHPDLDGAFIPAAAQLKPVVAGAAAGFVDSIESMTCAGNRDLTALKSYLGKSLSAALCAALRSAACSRADGIRLGLANSN